MGNFHSNSCYHFHISCNLFHTSAVEIENNLYHVLYSLQIVPSKDCKEIPLVTNLLINDAQVETIEKQTYITLLLNWTYPADMDDHFDVYYSEDGASSKLVGQACVNMYKVCKLKVAPSTRQVTFKVQQYTRTGFAVPLDKATSITFQLPISG